MCGEHARRGTAIWWRCGSSRRVRGTRPIEPKHGNEQRFIPACAGNTASPARSRVSPPVHPRVCGEHYAAAIGLDPADGSSPRVRGTRVRGVRRRGPRRFIPACAGNTTDFCPPRSSVPVHPRVCGEHGGGGQRRGAPNGSSPRVRGTQGHQRDGDAARRFIPACAGNTTGGAGLAAASPVHPRVCGEHAMRPRPASRWRRFIPACAGNTRPALTKRRTTPVHPRVCGEHESVAITRKPSAGSSPRVRGTRFTR